MAVTYLEHGFTMDRFKPTVTLPYTARDLEEMDERPKIKVQYYSSVTKKVPVHIDINELPQLAEDLRKMELEKSRQKVALGGEVLAGAGETCKLKLSLGLDLVRYLKVRAAMEGRSASALAEELLRGAIQTKPNQP